MPAPAAITELVRRFSEHHPRKTFLQRQIDQLVYERYGLTEEEINIVAGQ
jgi:hypothetical protein